MSSHSLTYLVSVAVPFVYIVSIGIPITVQISYDYFQNMKCEEGVKGKIIMYGISYSLADLQLLTWKNVLLEPRRIVAPM
jgi:hypothetical protein